MTYDGKTIHKRKDRKQEWYIRFYKNGRQFTVYGKTQREVIKKYKEAIKEKPKPKEKEYTLKQWFEKYLELYKVGKATDTTLRANKYEFAKVKRLYNVPIKELDQFEIQKVLNDIPYPSTRRRVYILLNAILERAYKNGLTQKNIMYLVDQPKYKAKEKLALTSKDQDKFVIACNNHPLGDFYLICLYQGLRKGECRALKVNDIDLENKTIRIDESLNKGTKRTNTKNEQSNRTMPLFDITKPIIEKLIQNKAKNELLFDYPAGQIEYALKDILKTIDIPHITTHTLRHTFITRCQEQNIPLYVVQAWVGHEKGSVVTTKIYTHLNEETNLRFADVINNIKK